MAEGDISLADTVPGFAWAQPDRRFDADRDLSAVSTRGRRSRRRMMGPMAEAGLWVAWGLPTSGRETQALDLLKETTTDYFKRLVQDGRIERFDTAILKPQTIELGGFILIQGTQPQIDTLRRDEDFQVWVNQVQLVADRVGMVDAWVDEGLSEATGLYEKALRKAGLTP